MKNSVHLITGLTILTLWSCGNFKSQNEPGQVARVHDTYLYKKDIEEKLPKNLSRQDSAVFVNNYIKHWATKQLFLDGAKQNLPLKKQREFKVLVDNYRQELYTEAYKDILISKKLDTNLTRATIQNYYDAHKNNFKLNKDLVKLRYIKLDKKFPAVSKIKKQLKRFNKDDKKALDKERLTFTALSLNDSVWISSRKLFEKIPPLDSEKRDKFLKKDKYVELNDSLSLYLIFIKNVRLRNQQAPLSYVKPTLKEILLNKRKLEIEKKLEKDITKDAIENKTFEIYN